MCKYIFICRFNIYNIWGWRWEGREVKKEIHYSLSIWNARSEENIRAEMARSQKLGQRRLVTTSIWAGRHSNQTNHIVRNRTVQKKGKNGKQAYTTETWNTIKKRVKKMQSTWQGFLAYLKVGLPFMDCHSARPHLDTLCKPHCRHRLFPVAALMASKIQPLY